MFLKPSSSSKNWKLQRSWAQIGKRQSLNQICLWKLYFHGGLELNLRWTLIKKKMKNWSASLVCSFDCMSEECIHYAYLWKSKTREIVSLWKGVGRVYSHPHHPGLGGQRNLGYFQVRGTPTPRKHRLKGVRTLKFFWAPCAQLYPIGWTPLTPSPYLAFIRGRYWSAKMDDISLWPPAKQFSL